MLLQIALRSQGHVLQMQRAERTPMDTINAETWCMCDPLMDRRQYGTPQLWNFSMGSPCLGRYFSSASIACLIVLADKDKDMADRQFEALVARFSTAWPRDTADRAYVFSLTSSALMTEDSHYFSLGEMMSPHWPRP